VHLDRRYWLRTDVVAAAVPVGDGIEIERTAELKREPEDERLTRKMMTEHVAVAVLHRLLGLAIQVLQLPVVPVCYNQVYIYAPSQLSERLENTAALHRELKTHLDIVDDLGNTLVRSLLGYIDVKT
jgi:hypothetical protein